jgi:hypothetical protein
MLRAEFIGVVGSVFLVFSSPALAQDCENAATIGSGGSAAAGDTAASTLGSGAVCNTGDQTNSTVGTAGSAASADGKAMSKTHTMGNKNKLQSQTKAQALDQGTFSKSRTKTKITDDGLESSTRTMSHVPGEKPVKNSTVIQEAMPQ